MKTRLLAPGPATALALAVVLVAACSSESGVAGSPMLDAGPSVDGAVPGSDGAAPGTDAASEASPGFPDDRGPGIYGALPSGYCCTKDAECKSRRCVDTGAGGGLCEDPCTADTDCDVPKAPFTCAVGPGQTRKSCQPPSGFTCVLAADFVRGKKPPGDCCAFVNGQAGGAECASHVCGSFGDGPFVCTNRCAVAADCPPDYTCELSGGDGYVPTCFPLALYSGGTYTCR